MNELLVFARAPRLGEVKTRLAETLGTEKALAAYISLLQELKGRLASVSNATVFFSPRDAEPELRRHFPAHWKFDAQRGVGLGERLRRAIGMTLERSAERVAVIGSDCPYVSIEDLEQAWRALDENDVIFGPANDGGYWLVAAKQLHPALFEGIDWGSASVLDQSLASARKLGLKVALLRQLSDVDTARDWLEFCNSSSRRDD